MDSRNFAAALARASSKLDAELQGVVACLLRRRKRSGRENVTPIEAAFWSACMRAAFGADLQAKARAQRLGRVVLIGC